MHKIGSAGADKPLSLDDKLKVVLDLKKSIQDIMSKSKNQSSMFDSIEEVGQIGEKIDNSIKLTAYGKEIPAWYHEKIFQFADLFEANLYQNRFYDEFKQAFKNGVYYDLQGNVNYALILIHDLIEEYFESENIQDLSRDFDILSLAYPDVKQICGKELAAFKNILKIKQNEQAKAKKKNYTIEHYFSELAYYNSSYYYQSLGERYRLQHNITSLEKDILSSFPIPNSFFANIEFCLFETCSLFLKVINEFLLKYSEQGFHDFLLEMAAYVYKNDGHFKKPTKKISLEYGSIFMENIFRKCETAVRFSMLVNKTSFLKFKNIFDNSVTYITNNLLNDVDVFIDKHKHTIQAPDANSDRILDLELSGRWNLKYAKIKPLIKEDLDKAFKETILLIENLQHSANLEKLIIASIKDFAKKDSIMPLQIFLNYVYIVGLKYRSFRSVNFSLIPPKTFKSDEAQETFFKIVERLDSKSITLSEAIKELRAIYTEKRKTIKLDKSKIKKAKEKHIDTVEVLSEYLKDEEIKTVQATVEIKETPIKKEFNNYLPELKFTPVQLKLLELFSKNNFVILQSNMEVFAKSNKVFKNSLIDSINEICFDILDDNLIEEDGAEYIINTDYLNKLKK